MEALLFLLLLALVVGLVTEGSRALGRLSATVQRLRTDLALHTQINRSRHERITRNLRELQSIAQGMTADLEALTAEPPRLDLIRTGFLPVAADLHHVRACAVPCGAPFAAQADYLVASLAEVIVLVDRMRAHPGPSDDRFSVEDATALRVHAQYARRHLGALLESVQHEYGKWGGVSH